MGTICVCACLWGKIEPEGNEHVVAGKLDSVPKSTGNRGVRKGLQGAGATSLPTDLLLKVRGLPK